MSVDRFEFFLADGGVNVEDVASPPARLNRNGNTVPVFQIVHDCVERRLIGNSFKSNPIFWPMVWLGVAVAIFSYPVAAGIAPQGPPTIWLAASHVA